MNGGRRSMGYTVVEVMIVLAVSAMMFVIASSFINGKQERTAFTSGVNDLAAQIQDTIEDVTDGHYTDIRIKCTFSGVGTSIGGPGLAQGTNAPCVFLGKVIHFPGSNLPGQYEVISMAGGRVNAGVPITTLAGAYPTPISSLTKMQQIPQSLDLKFPYNIRVKTAPGATTMTYAIAFIQSQGNNDPSGVLNSGSQTVGLYYAHNITGPTNQIGAEAALRNSGSLLPAQSAEICVTDEHRYAIIGLGTDSTSQLAVNVKMLGQTSC